MMDNKKILRTGGNNNMEIKENEKKNNAGIQGNSDILPIRAKLYNDMLGNEYNDVLREKGRLRGDIVKRL